MYARRLDVTFAIYAVTLIAGPWYPWVPSAVDRPRNSYSKDERKCSSFKKMYSTAAKRVATKQIFELCEMSLLLLAGRATPEDRISWQTQL
jgi:hypothetical protein